MNKNISEKGFVEITPSEGMWLFDGKDCLSLVCVSMAVADKMTLEEVDDAFKKQWEREHPVL